MLRFAVFAILGLAPLAASAVHGRCVLQLYGGGGAASDLYVGAGLGRDWLLDVQPSASLDLSLSPELKLSSQLGGAYAAYTESRFAAGAASAQTDLRWLLRSGEASLALSGERTSYTTGAPLDLSTLSMPAVTESTVLRAAPLVRWEALGVEWRAAGFGGFQQSATAAGTVSERAATALLGAGGRLGRTMVAASYRLQRDWSDRPDFAFTAHALFVALDRKIGPPVVQACLQLQSARFGTGTRENLLRAALAAALELSPGLEIEAVYSYSASWTLEPSGTASRHLVTLGARARSEVAAW